MTTREQKNITEIAVEARTNTKNIEADLFRKTSASDKGSQEEQSKGNVTQAANYKPLQSPNTKKTKKEEEVRKATQVGWFLRVTLKVDECINKFNF